MRQFRERHHVHLPYYLAGCIGLELLVFIINHGHL